MSAMMHRLLLATFFASPFLFSMEKPPEPAQRSSVPTQLTPFERLSKDLKGYVATFLTRGVGRTSEAKLHSAVDTIQTFMTLSKSFALLLEDEKINDLLVRQLAHYTKGNLTQAALALSTVGATACLEKYRGVPSQYYPLGQQIKFAAALGQDIRLRKLLASGYHCITKGARINAARAGHVSTIELLFAPTIHILNQPGCQTPLMAACVGGHTEVVRKLLALGEDPCAIYSRGTYAVGQTVLMFAAQWGYKDIVTLLLDTPARGQIDLADVHGITCLMRAAEHGNSEIVQALLDAGATTELQDQVQLTALTRAVGTDCNNAEYITVVRLLLAAGAHVNVRDGTGRTALTMARTNPADNLHKKEIERILLQHGAVI